MASISLQPRQKRDLWLRVMTETKRGTFWPRFNMPRFLNRGRISKIIEAKRGYCTSDNWYQSHFFLVCFVVTTLPLLVCFVVTTLSPYCVVDISTDNIWWWSESINFILISFDSNSASNSKLLCSVDSVIDSWIMDFSKEYLVESKMK